MSTAFFAASENKPTQRANNLAAKLKDKYWQCTAEQPSPLGHPIAPICKCHHTLYLYHEFAKQRYNNFCGPSTLVLLYGGVWKVNRHSAISVCLIFIAATITFYDRDMKADCEPKKCDVYNLFRVYVVGLWVLPPCIPFPDFKGRGDFKKQLGMAY